MPTAQILAVSTRDHPDSTSEFTNAGGEKMGTRQIRIDDHVPIVQSSELHPPAGSHGGTEIPTKIPAIKLDRGDFATGKQHELKTIPQQLSCHSEALGHSVVEDDSARYATASSQNVHDKPASPAIANAVDVKSTRKFEWYITGKRIARNRTVSGLIASVRPSC